MKVGRPAKYEDREVSSIVFNRDLKKRVVRRLQYRGGNTSFSGLIDQLLTRWEKEQLEKDSEDFKSTAIFSSLPPNKDPYQEREELISKLKPLLRIGGFEDINTLNAIKNDFNNAVKAQIHHINRSSGMTYDEWLNLKNKPKQKREEDDKLLL